MKPRHIAFLLAAALLSGSCIHNDIPYPVVDLKIEAVEGEGFAVKDIDYKQRIVTLTLEEATDIRNVRIDRATLTEGATPSQPLTGTFDLRTPLYVTLSLYQDYEWTICAEQPIARYFEVEGQFGETEFDIENRIARAKVSTEMDLAHVIVKRLKLGPAEITRMSPTLEELSGTSFESVRYVDIAYHDIEERWLLYLDPTNINAELTQADAWARSIWLQASVKNPAEAGFRYRRTGSEEWTEVPDVTQGTGTISARLRGITPQTSYEIVAYSGTSQSAVRTVTTEEARQLPNSDFELWSKPKKPWLPYLTDAEAYWDSGNHGATTLSSKDNVTTPVEDVRPGSAGKYSAQLESRWVVIKFAAGNLFTGKYAETNGSNGTVNFGRKFTSRPSRLRGWVKYNRGTINKIGDRGSQESVKVSDRTLHMGDPDNGSIYIALGTWTKEQYGKDKEGDIVGTDDSPVSIDTRDQSTFFKSNSEAVIAYGELILEESTADWQEFSIDLVYTSTSAVPTHLIVVCSASRWGDYFAGGTDSRMWVDDFSLEYD